MPPEPRVVVQDTALSLAKKAADEFARAAFNAVEKRGSFAVAISGGSTPGGLYRLLASEPYISEVPWDVTHIFWVDERCVPASHPYSNYGSAKKAFIERVPISQGQVHPMDGEALPREGAQQYEDELRCFFRVRKGENPVFDLILLGVGKDGHTASLFPGERSLNERQRLIVAVKGGDPQLNRLTMTLPVLKAARHILFLVSGKDKAGVIKFVFEGNHSGLPVQKVLGAPAEEIIWLLDREAASGLHVTADNNG